MQTRELRLNLRRNACFLLNDETYKLSSYLTTAIEEQVANRGQPIFGHRLKGRRQKMFHIFHFLQSNIAFVYLSSFAFYEAAFFQ